MSKEAFVYRWYDAPNDMYYLGKHKGSPDDKYTHSSSIWESFTKDNIPEGVTREIIAYGTDEEMCILEHKLLKFAKENGIWDRYYNVGVGDPRYVDISGENNWNWGKTGEKSHMWGFKHSPETLKKLSEINMGEKNGMYGKTHAELGTKFSDRHGENNSFYGKTHSEEHKQKYSYGEKNPMYGKPSAFTGGKHTEENKKRASEKRKSQWADPNSIYNTPQFRKKMSEASSGSNNGMYGKKHTEETKRKISETKARKKTEKQGAGTLDAFLK
jgi:hypothetical protein